MSEKLTPELWRFLYAERTHELQAALERVRKVEQQRDRLREALQPFADEASAYDEAKPYPDEDAHLGGFSDYTFGDLLRARSVVRELETASDIPTEAGRGGRL